MMNQVSLTGNLGDAPEMRFTPSGVPVASFSLAVNRSWTDGSGDRQTKTTWVRVTAWRKLAEICSQYLVKGSKILLTGELEAPRAYVGKDGKPAASLEVTATAIEFLDNKSQGETQQQPEQRQSLAYSREDAHRSQQAQGEDIPF